MSALSRLSARERMLILLMALAGGLAAGYSLFWEPMAQARAQAMGSIERTDRLAAQLAPWRGEGLPPLPVAAENLTAVVAETARDRGLSIRRLEPEEGRARVSLEETDFDALLGWLAELQTDHAVRVAAIEIERRPEPGIVAARMTLGR